MNFDAESVPECLKSRTQWVCWEEQSRDGKMTKIPKRPDSSGRNAKSNDMATWGSFEDAVKTANRNDWGLGFMFTSAGPYLGIDLDHCFDADGNLKEWLPSLDQFRDETYIERSPSGDGLHIILRDDRLPNWWTNQEDERGGVEAYEDGRFFTVTGDLIESAISAVNKTATLQSWFEDAWAVFNDDDPRETAGGADGSRASPPSHTDTGDVDIYDVLSRSRYPEGERKEHPIHGSDTGSNFSVDAGGDTWVCWRGTCNPTGDGDATVGNALHLIGMQEGIISCGEWAGSGLDSDTWRSIFDAARSQGYDIPPKETATKPDDETVESIDIDESEMSIDPAKMLDSYDVGQWSPSEILNSNTTIRGQVAKRGPREVRHETVGFECDTCGTLVRIAQNGDDIRGPTGECDSCGSEKYVRKDSATDTQDYQQIRLQKLPEKSSTGTDSGINIDLLDNSVGSVSPGDRIVVEAGIDLVDEHKRVSELYGTAKGIHHFDQSIEDVDIEPHRDAIEAVANSDDPDALDILADSLAPDHYGDRTVKKALVLQMFGGVSDDAAGGKRRGTIHVALIGEPSTGKSGLMDSVASVLPRTIKTTGQGSTSAGLTATAVQSEFAGSGDTAGWTLEAGALVKASGSIAAIDELDKMDKKDRNGMLQAMSEQEITVAKAGMNTTLPADTTVLAAANPKHGRFDPMEDIVEQFDFSPVLLSRFDLVFKMVDTPDTEEDKELVTHMLNSTREDSAPEVDKETFRAYAALGRTLDPELTDDATEAISDHFVTLRGEDGDADNRSITTRSVEAIRRLAEASARIHLREQVTTDDVECAIQIHNGYLSSIGAIEIDDDGDVVVNGEPFTESSKQQSLDSATQQERITATIDLIRNMEYDDDSDQPGCDAAAIRNALMDRGITDRKAKQTLDQLEQNDEIYKPNNSRVATL